MTKRLSKKATNEALKQLKELEAQAEKASKGATPADLNEKLHELETIKDEIVEHPTKRQAREKLLIIIRTLADPDSDETQKCYTLYEDAPEGEEGPKTTQEDLEKKSLKELIDLAEGLFEQAYKDRIIWDK